MAMFWQCIRGPRLFRFLQQGAQAGQNYEANALETYAGKLITTLRFCWSLSYWTSPVLIGILYRRGHFTSEGLQGLTRMLTYVTCLYLGAIVTRGFGRYLKADYVVFITDLTSAQKSLTRESRRMLDRFDFEFKACPVDWKVSQVTVSEAKKIKVQAGNPSRRGSFFTIPCDILAYLAAHTFGRRMMYPGATALIATLTEPMLNQGRAKLIEEKSGIRKKVLTEDNNELDTMFLDRRHTAGTKGRTLVLCSEGNAGFYEVGAMGTPTDLGYSVLGWNQPGFAGSSGMPVPTQVQNGVDAMMQYAIHELGFTPDNIILYAWSIGGYPASWAAMNYPDVKCVILDATFDDVLPLALNQMPEFAGSLVKTTIRTYLNLNVAEQLTQYLGPVLLIRRSRDEMISTNRDPNAVNTNRGNFLLQRLLQTRYPKLVGESTNHVLEAWLNRTFGRQVELLVEHEVDPDLCETMLKSYSLENGMEFPTQFGDELTERQKQQLVLYLASKHMEEYESTHCTPLPGQFFHDPWHV